MGVGVKVGRAVGLRRVGSDSPANLAIGPLDLTLSITDCARPQPNEVKANKINAAKSRREVLVIINSFLFPSFRRITIIARW
ncbi:MAG: hypothetical protein EHM12_07155 [Dehalococcoidia bacterium]|nr:MAG: hypothetical protein EHM12_07155 [Dehalococcoidia bacterium]